MSGNLYIAVRGEAAPGSTFTIAREAACLHLDREGAANVASGYGENANLVYLSSGKRPYTIRLA